MSILGNTRSRVLLAVGLCLAFGLGAAQAVSPSVISLMAVGAISTVILAKPELALILLPLANAIPLRVSPYIGLFMATEAAGSSGLGSVAIPDVLICILGVSIGMRLVLRRTKLMVPGSLLIAIGLLGFTAFISSLLLRAPSFSGMESAVALLEQYLLPLALLLMVAGWLRDQNAIERAALVLVVSGVIQTMGILLPVFDVLLPGTRAVSYDFGYSRYSVFWTASNITGASLAMTASLSWYLAQAGSRRRRFMFLAAFMIQVFGVLPTLSRSSWMAIPVALLSTSLIHFPRRSLFRYLILGGFLAVAAYVQLSSIDVDWLSSFNLGGNRPLQVDNIRLFIWQSAVASIAQQVPFIGLVAPGAFALSQYSQMFLGVAHVHNAFLQVAFETGLVGELGFIIILCVCMRPLAKVHTQIVGWSRSSIAMVYMGLLAGLIALLFVGLFEPLISWPSTSMLLMYGLGLLYVCKRAMVQAPLVPNGALA